MRALLWRRASLLLALLILLSLVIVPAAAKMSRHLGYVRRWRVGRGRRIARRELTM